MEDEQLKTIFWQFEKRAVSLMKIESLALFVIPKISIILGF